VTAILIATVLLWTYSSHITGRMETLRATIGDFDHPRETAEYVEAKSEFDHLHHTYTTLVGTNMIILLGAFSLSVINSHRSR